MYLGDHGDTAITGSQMELPRVEEGIYCSGEGGGGERRTRRQEKEGRGSRSSRGEMRWSGGKEE